MIVRNSASPRQSVDFGPASASSDGSRLSGTFAVPVSPGKPAPSLDPYPRAAGGRFGFKTEGSAKVMRRREQWRQAEQRRREKKRGTSS